MQSDSKTIVAAIQMGAKPDKRANLRTADGLVETAADRGAQLVLLPEYFNLLDRMEAVVQQAEPVPGPTTDWLSEIAHRWSIWLVGGICEASQQAGKAHNTAVVVDPQGDLVCTYRKMHLFDISLPDEIEYEESRHILPGDGLQVVDLPFAKAGLATCYDLRFPELFRQMSEQGAELFLLPSAFSAPTGKDHWEPLVRARAIENQSYVLAANQRGEPVAGLATYGHSMLVDPWGDVVEQLADEPTGIVLGDFDRDRLETVRRHLPALSHRRIF